MTSTSIVVPWHWRVIPDHLPVPATLIKLSLMMRYTRKVSAGFDVVFGVFNETDYGRKGIQYIHYPTYLRPRPEVDLRWYHAAARRLERSTTRSPTASPISRSSG